MQYKRLINLFIFKKKAAALLPVDVTFEPLFTRQQVFLNIPNNTCAFPVVSKWSAMTQTVDDNTAGVCLWQLVIFNDAILMNFCASQKSV